MKAGLLGVHPSAVVLHPGDVAYGERGDRMSTLLGSCVSIILTDPRRTVGAMSHIVHARPASARGGGASAAAYGGAALQKMYGLLRAHAIEPKRCQAYIYGGGNMFPGMYPQMHVGASNSRWALDALESEGVEILHHDLGGATYRRLSWTVGPESPQVAAMPI